MANSSFLTPKLKKTIFRILLYLFSIIGGFIILLVLLVRIGMFGNLPGEPELKKIKHPIATEIITVDEKILGRYYYQNRTNIKIEKLPKHLTDALVATEDVRFYKHHGTDTRSMLRVFFRTLLLSDQSGGGGSTITQQLAKNLFPRKSYSFLTIPVVKIREIFIARRIEKIYDKTEILELYLNTVSFGENTFGIETAALVFFNKKPENLKAEESAMLVGLLKANSNYNPRKNPEAALKRRNVVLSQMAKYHYIDKEAKDSLQATPLVLNFHRYTHNEGPAPYLREYLRQEVSEILNSVSKADGSKYNLYADGLRIYTTINYTMQTLAEEAVKEHMSQLQQKFDRQWKGKEPWIADPSVAKWNFKQTAEYKQLVQNGVPETEALDSMKRKREMRIFSWNGDKDTLMSPYDSVLYHFKTLQTGVLLMNGKNGDILAWIGGSGYKYFQYDHVKARRQVGSTFKPIVYAAGIESGISPCKFYANDSVVYSRYNNWTPENAESKYGGYYTVKGALAHSVNTVSVKVMLETGIDSTLFLAKKMGIQSNLPEYPSMALGAGEISLYEMVRAYCCFLNNGRPVEPRLIRRIEDNKGNVIYAEKSHIPGDSVMSAETAQTILAMMQGTVNRGTATSLRSVYGLQSDLAGKTGTTQNQTDGWFIGMNPNLVMGIWVGGDNVAVRFRSLTHGQGSQSALPVFGRFFKKIYADPVYKYMASASFQIPEEVYENLSCPDYSEQRPFELPEIFIQGEGKVSDIIRRIFSRKKKKDEQSTE